MGKKSGKKKKQNGGKKAAYQTAPTKGFEQLASVDPSAKIYLLGLGATGSMVLPALLRHLKCKKSQIITMSMNEKDAEVAAAYGIKFFRCTLDASNVRYNAILNQMNKGDLMVACTSGVSSIALINLCREKGALYVDSSNEPWDECGEDEWDVYGRRSLLLKQVDRAVKGEPTAIVDHGANPGVVNHLVKQALMTMGRDEYGADLSVPSTQEQWADLACKLEVQMIQISERDTQRSFRAKKVSEFMCPWSPQAMIDELEERSQIPLGSHDSPPDGWKRETKDPALPDTALSPTMAALVKGHSVVPSTGPFVGFITPHAETFSIAEYLATKDGKYKPTVFFCYRPPDATVISVWDWLAHDEDMEPVIMSEDIVSGKDELGVLIARRNRTKVLWIGSQLTTEKAREVMTGSTATTLQVVSGVLGAVCYALSHPAEGLLDPDQMNHLEVLDIAIRYFGKLVTEWIEWDLREDDDEDDESNAEFDWNLDFVLEGIMPFVE